MKTRLLFILSFFLFLTACSWERSAEAQVYVSVYANIPLAPNVVVSVGLGTPVGRSPGIDYIWIDGYWTWDSYYYEYRWVDGYWAIAPYSGAYWVPGYWEYYRGGYRWIDAYWIPRGSHIHYGYSNGRYDYYGRPVYYHQPNHSSYGYAYSYDPNPNHRERGYNSSAYFNNYSTGERDRINREYRNPRQAPTTSSRQEANQIRGNRNDYTSRETTTTTRTSSRTETITRTDTDSRNRRDRSEVNSRNENRSESVNSDRTRIDRNNERRRTESVENSRTETSRQSATNADNRQQKVSSNSGSRTSRTDATTTRSESRSDGTNSSSNRSSRGK